MKIEVVSVFTAFHSIKHGGNGSCWLLTQFYLSQVNSRRVTPPAQTTTKAPQPTVASVPKYDSGIEMEQQTTAPAPPVTTFSSPPMPVMPTTPASPVGEPAVTSAPRPRNNVNLLVQQLTEEARQREALRQKLQQEDPEQDDDDADLRDAVVVHNKNIPFSYMGGSPTRLSQLRRMSPPRTAHPPPLLMRTADGRDADVVYAQVLFRSFLPRILKKIQCSRNTLRLTEAVYT